MTAMLIVGIDPSAKRIAIVAHETILKVQAVKTADLYLKGETKQTMESLGRAVTAMEDFVAWADEVCPSSPRVAWVEDPLVGRGGTTTTVKQSYVGGIIRGVLVASSFQVYGVNVSTWKSQVCGNGRADKRDVSRAVGVRWPKIARLVGDDVDLTDAAAICIYAEECVRKGLAITAPGVT